MIVGTAWPLIVRSGRSLLVAAPDTIDVNGVREDVERITGSDSVHDLHVWSIGSSLLALAFTLMLRIQIARSVLHLYTSGNLARELRFGILTLRCDNDSIASFDSMSENIRKASQCPCERYHTNVQCLHLWGIHSVTIQPEPQGASISGSLPAFAEDPVDRSAAALNPTDGAVSHSDFPRTRSAMPCARQCAYACPDQLAL